MIAFVPGKVAESTIAIAVVLPCVAVIIVIAVVFYCYKAKNRSAYTLFHEFQKASLICLSSSTIG